MWVKEMKDGTIIVENRAKGITWLKTPAEGIAKVYLVNNKQKSPELVGMSEYWHSRGAVMDPLTGRMVDTIERIQGKVDEVWLTITWNGKSYSVTREPRAIGKPVIHGKHPKV